ncbi:MAG TPA: flagellar hook-length control protein FliK [Baekduia sp.]|uniref:flagellar hook-length control protein FliK n=1 Tax=Baekduia sp. TaxID=2600305 RepID=UPI002D0509A5|nr:flagellar hook-length control protein FliK [Baekduia sp.]HMJ37897.1 flagellar hook-length control protein FliK [Baekduia sp.]
MQPTTITPPTGRVDAPRSSPPPGSSPEGFAALLDQTTARTAAAEGPQTRPARAEASRRRPQDPAPQDAATTAGAAVADPATEVAPTAPSAPSAPTAAPPAPEERPASADGQAAPAGAALDLDAPPTLYTATDATAMGAAVLPGLPDPTVAAAAPAAPGVPAAATPAAPGTPGTPVAPGTPSAPVVSGVPVSPADLQVTDPEGDVPAGATSGAPAGAIAIPTDLLAAKTGADAQGKDQDRQDGAPDLAQLLKGATPDPAAAAATPAAAPAPAHAAAPPDASASPVPAPTVAPPVLAQPAATPLTAVPTAAGTPQLTRSSVVAAADRVQDLVRIATTRNGGARALLQLKPAELGAVDVHLRTTREGLVATIAAHDQAGLDALQQAGGELRRTLEDRGVQLHRLDLQLGAGQGGFGNRADARQASSGSRSAGRPDALGLGDEADDDLILATVSTSTPAGALVDVQA